MEGCSGFWVAPGVSLGALHHTMLQLGVSFVMTEFSIFIFQRGNRSPEKGSALPNQSKFLAAPGTLTPSATRYSSVASWYLFLELESLV
jgi:hypothetical protein